MADPDRDRGRELFSGQVASSRESRRATSLRGAQLAAESETDISVHAPNCGVHVGLERFDAFHQWSTPDSSDVAIPVDLGNDATAHDAIYDWFNPGGSFQRVRRIDTDEPGVSFSSCP